VRPIAVVACLWLALVDVPSVDGPQAARAPGADVRRTVPLAAGRTLTVHVSIGDVRVHGEARSDAQIDVVRKAPSAAGLARIPVSFDEDGDGIRVDARQQGNGTDAAYRTDVTLRVPRDARLSAIRVVEGRLTVTSFAGRIDASVRRGPIEVSDIQGTIRLETEIGDITASGARLVPDGLLRLRTFNGNVRLALAERPRNARILALALNGTIESAIPLTMRDTWGPRWGEATLGTGDPVISIDVVNGNIRLSAAHPQD
jgi:hypothetical protein